MKKPSKVGLVKNTFKTAVVSTFVLLLPITSFSQDSFEAQGTLGDFIAPIVSSESNLSATPTGLIYYNLTDGAFKGVNKNGGFDTLSSPGKPVSSDTANERIERLFIGSACTSSPCTITSSSGAIASVTRTSAGIYTINFTSGKFSAAPSCVITSLNTSTLFCSGGATSATTFGVNCQRSSTEVSTDSAFTAICMGPR